MKDSTSHSRRQFLRRIGLLGIAVGALPQSIGHAMATTTTAPPAPSMPWKPPVLPSRKLSAAQGALADRTERALARLHQAPYTENYILADLDFNMPRDFTEFSGDVSGRIVGVCGIEAATGLPQTWPLAELIPKVSASQKPDGHFGKDEDLAHSVDGTRDTPILWGNGRMLIGLIEAYEGTGSAAALDAAKALGDHYVHAHPYLDKPELVHKFGNYAWGFQTCYFSGLEGVVRLAQITGDAAYRDQAINMASLMMRTNPIGEQHSHGRLCALRGFLDLYEVTNDPQYLSYVVSDAQAYRTQYLFPTGGISEMTIRSNTRDEGCTEADWLRLNLQLWRLTGEDLYLHTAEMVLLNELAINQYKSGGFGHLGTPQVGNQMDGYYAQWTHEGREATYCCSMHGPRALMDVPQHAVVARGRDVFVNLYEPVATTLSIESSPVHFSLQPVQDGQKVVMTIRVDRPTDFALRLRVPVWASQFAVADADGKALPHKSDAQGRYVVARKWGKETTLTIHQPYTLIRRPLGSYAPDQELARAGAGEPVALYLGPYLLGRPLDTASAYPDAKLSAAKVDTAALTVTVPGAQGAVTVYTPVHRITEDGSGFRVHVTPQAA